VRCRHRGAGAENGCGGGTAPGAFAGWKLRAQGSAGTLLLKRARVEG